LHAYSPDSHRDCRLGRVRLARPRQQLGNLPAEVTSFVGRRRELGEIRNKLATARLVSLVGPGGVGKTRLALRAAANLGRGFADGAWVVELAEVRDGALLPSAVVTGLDLRDQAATKPLQIVIAYLQDKQLLLLLDNCEHLIGPAAELVADVLHAAPNVRVVTTSREPLQLPGEHVIAVPPLELPDANGSEPFERVRQNDAVALFSERAAAASGTFGLTASNQSGVVRLCRRLDGVPLAIELAAVRTRVLTVDQIVDRLSDRFGLLTGGSRAALPRHQTLRTAIDWSHDLLTVSEQALLRRLGVFAGRFTLEDAESVCAFDEVPAPEALEAMSSLVDKSLVMRDDVKEVACFRLHETMREYANLKLHEAKEDDRIEERFLEYYRTRCVQTADHAWQRTREWLEWNELEIDNIRSVLQRCVAHADSERGLDVAGSLGYYWIMRATTEAVRWLDELFATDAGLTSVNARACRLRGWLSLLQVDPNTARPWLARAVAAARESGQLSLLSESLTTAANAERVAGDATAAQRLLDEAETLTLQLHDYRATIGVIQARAVGAMFQGDRVEAEAASSAGVQLSREVGDLYMLGQMLVNVGLVAILGGDVQTSKPRFIEAMRAAREIDDRAAQFFLLNALGWQAANAGQARLAAELLGAAEAVQAGAGSSVTGPFGPMLDAAKESSIAAVGAAKFEAAFEAGKRLSRGEAVRLALGEPEDVEGVAPARVGAGPLAKRELEVAQLIAEGLSNKQIAARLSISDRTVATHVGHILNKLGFNSRAQVATWVASSNR
jgi:predicted ATPase/DNA-binding CsgD family transcriptional regulator